MIASAHLAAGAVAAAVAVSLGGSRTRRVVTAFVFGVLSHVMLDAVPHSDYEPFPQDRIFAPVLIEVLLISLVLGWILRRRLRMHWPSYLGGLAGASVPDAKFFARWPMPDRMAALVQDYGNWFHDFFHAPRPALDVGWVTQIVSALILLAILTLLARAR